MSSWLWAHPTCTDEPETRMCRVRRGFSCMHGAELLREKGTGLPETVPAFFDNGIIAKALIRA